MNKNARESQLMPFVVGKQEAAVLLGGVCVRTIENLIARGDLKPWRLGGRTMVTMASIRRLVSHDVESPSPSAKVKPSRQANPEVRP